MKQQRQFKTIEIVEAGSKVLTDWDNPLCELSACAGIYYASSNVLYRNPHIKNGVILVCGVLNDD